MSVPLLRLLFGNLLPSESEQVMTAQGATVGMEQPEKRLLK
jgi:hypothetical protein